MSIVTHMTPEELIARIRQDRAAFAALWQGLGEAEMLAHPGPQVDWSVKDLIAHITWWEQFIWRNIHTPEADEVAQVLADVDETNQGVFIASKDRPLLDVLAAFEASLAPLLTQISEFSADALNSPLPGGGSALQYYIDNTWGHYGEHYDDLAGYISRLK